MRSHFLVWLGLLSFDFDLRGLQNIELLELQQLLPLLLSKNRSLLTPLELCLLVEHERLLLLVDAVSAAGFVEGYANCLLVGASVERDSV